MVILCFNFQRVNNGCFRVICIHCHYEQLKILFQIKLEKAMRYVSVHNVLKDETLETTWVMSTPRVKYMLQVESIVYINDTTFTYSIL